MKPAPADLALILGHPFARPELLEQALTHPSAITANRHSTAYERLEFLGDRVLGLAVAEMLFLRFPDEAEGALARRHAALVRRESLARVADAIGLAAHLRLSKGEEDTGGRANPGLLADACEAVIGAIYADGGLEPARRFVQGRWRLLMDEDISPPKDPKTALQEWAQGRALPLPTYTVQGTEGPSHAPIFRISVAVGTLAPAEGSGPSKRAAEQEAARAMLATVPS